jgi:hypothetical protein
MVYPNPATDKITLSPGIDTYIIRDVNGRVVKEGKSSGTVEIKLLNPGVYIITLSDTKGKTSHQKFIKQ